jgi:glycosyltransferase involved in cell wall biosynthesis
MRVAILADPYVPIPPPKYGGTEQVIINLIKGLQELGHEPVLFASGDSSVPCELIATTPEAVYFPATKLEMPAYMQKVNMIARRTESLLKKQLPSFDVLHWHANMESPFDMRKFAEHPHVATMHGPVRFKDINFVTENKNLNWVTISKNQQEAFPDLNYVGVVYNGENPAEFPIVTEPEDYVCFIGRFDREKNPHMAIMLAISLGIPIKIAGKIDYLGDGYFQDEIEPYLTHPLVEYMGELDFDAKVELMSKARCNLHPTGFREPFGLTIIEAAYCGTPTLAIRKGSMPELIEEGRTGLMVEDFIEGYHRLQECFDMDRLYVAKRARSLFNYRSMAEGYLKAYDKVIEAYKEKAAERTPFQTNLFTEDATKTGSWRKALPSLKPGPIQSSKLIQGFQGFDRRRSKSV